MHKYVSLIMSSNQDIRSICRLKSDVKINVVLIYTNVQKRYTTVLYAT